MSSRVLPALVLVGAFSLGCSSGSAGGSPRDGGGGGDVSVAVEAGGDASDASSHDGPSGEAGVTPGPDTTVNVFQATPVFFGPTMNQRTVDKTVTFPATGAYAGITLHLALTCPTAGCDIWDRFGTLAIVRPVSTTDAGTTEQLIEVARFVTPYGLPPSSDPQPSWDIDVTELRPLLSGIVTLRAFIDTWVPQNVTNEGYGWDVTATFTMRGGIPAKLPVAVVPIWSWTTTNKEPTQVVYGDPAMPIAQSLPPQTVTLPAGATSWGVRSFITGHGQGNLDDCSEFCSRTHTWSVGTTANTKTVWRTDCQNYPSGGTYQYPRAGWCPGVDVDAWDFDVTSQVTAGGGRTATFTYGVDAYLNTCNAGADGGGPCTGCQAGEGCAYDGAGHTQPFYYVSALLVGFR
jgi:hypothetical protein